MKKRIFGLILILFCINFIYSLPNITIISGTINNNQNITISGSGFGTKTNAAPLVWDDFTKGTPGTSIIDKSPKQTIIPSFTWQTTDSGAATPPTYDNNLAEVRAGLSSCTKHDFNSDPDNYNSCYGLKYYPFNKIYFTFWYKIYEPTWNTCKSRNTKPWVIYGEGNGGVVPAAYIGNGNPDYGDGGYRDSIQDMLDSETYGEVCQIIDPYNGTSLCNCKGCYHEWGDLDLSSVHNKWIRMEAYLVQSDPYPGPFPCSGSCQTGNPNGMFLASIHDQTNPIHWDFNGTNIWTRVNNNNWTWQQTTFGGAFFSRDDTYPDQTCVANGFIYTDSAYIDNTLARIEICNTNNWNTRTHCEIQIPYLWNNGQIGITLNQGSFANGSTAYLFVIDANGTASTGKQITFGGSQEPPTSNKTTIQNLIYNFKQFKSGQNTLVNYINKIKEFLFG
jgi:hypothetical protein